MAKRDFLVSIDLLQNELLNAVHQNLAAHPSTPLIGQSYFNTTLKTFFIYSPANPNSDGSGWLDLGGSTTTNLSQGTRTTTSVDVNSSTGTPATLLEATTLLAGVLSSTKFNEIAANTLKVSNISTQLSLGTLTSTSMGITSDGGADDVILPEATTSLAGLLSAAKWNEIVANTAKLTANTANVDAAGAVMNSDTSTAAMSFVIDEDSFASDLATKVPTQQSVKAYIATQIAGALTSEMSFKGDYNAATNTPLLDATPIATAVGDTYVVTAAGNFFSIPVEIGDMLIAKVANATLETDWVIVNKNLDASSILAALLTVDGAGSLLDSDLLDGQHGAYYLAWANFTGIPSTFAPAAHTLDSHSNVTITSNSAGEVLKWNGTAWINNTLIEAGMYMPTAFAWVGGTTAGPTGTLTMSGGSNIAYAAFPSASATASGIVTTAAQVFAGAKTFNNGIITTNLQSTVATGTAPLTVASTTVVTNLNADLLDGLHAAAFQLALTNPVTGTGTVNTIAYWSATGVIGALPLASYPSLAELAYVKGTTSNIQTQLNARSRKYVANIGGALGITITAATHGLGTSGDFTVSIRYISTGAFVDCEILTNATTGDVTFNFNTAPAAASLRVVIIG
jgi:hypothetical protein